MAHILDWGYSNLAINKRKIQCWHLNGGWYNIILYQTKPPFMEYDESIIPNDSKPKDSETADANRLTKQKPLDFSKEKLTNSEVFEQALHILREKFPIEKKTAGNKTPDSPKKQTDEKLDAEKIDYIPARMINEFVYCPRLFYYEFVESIFLDNADTLRGTAVHSRVDTGNGSMPPANKNASENHNGEKTDNKDLSISDDTIHARSVMLFSDKLGVTAKIDLVEVKTENEQYLVCPVDYKAGAPKKDTEGIDIWDADKIQLGLQALLLRENGYQCNEGIIYYRETRQRVHLPITEELENWITQQIKNARIIAAGNIPPPLPNSPKCTRCSLAPICMPDETTLLNDDLHHNKQIDTEKIRLDTEFNKKSRKIVFKLNEVRRLMAPRDDKRSLYLTTQGLKVGRNNEVLEIKENQKVIETVRLNDVHHISLFGNIQITTQAVQSLCYAEIPITYFSMGGWFYGITRGHGLKNVFTRINQFKTAADESQCLKYATKFVFGKIRNQRTMLMRNHLEPPKDCIRKLKQLSDLALTSKSTQELLGTEGIAANIYFENFNGMIKAKDELDLLNDHKEETDADKTTNEMTFNFKSRNRRPPTDPVNALLSLAYSLLAKDCTIAALAVGFDPYIGFYHRPRFGRPALALDLMEEFRPIIAESVVITAINNRMLNQKDFVKSGKSVNLNAAGRKKFFYAYEQRMNTIFTHPIFDYKITYRRALEIQARLLAKTLTDEISEYVPIIVR